MLAEELSKNKGVNYFPSYELVIDQLRDHRFYKEDLVHPNEIAVDHIWEAFEKWCLNITEQEARRKVLKINMFERHFAFKEVKQRLQFHQLPKRKMIYQGMHIRYCLAQKKRGLNLVSIIS